MTNWKSLPHNGCSVTCLPDILDWCYIWENNITVAFFHQKPQQKATGLSEPQKLKCSVTPRGGRSKTASRQVAMGSFCSCFFFLLLCLYSVCKQTPASRDISSAYFKSIKYKLVCKYTVSVLEDWGQLSVRKVFIALWGAVQLSKEIKNNIIKIVWFFYKVRMTFRNNVKTNKECKGKLE